MAVKIALYYLGEPKTGGWVTYIKNMVRSLNLIGVKPLLFKIGKKTQARSRVLCEGINIRTISFNDAKRVNKKLPFCIVAMALKDEFKEMSIEMLSQGNGSIIHHGCGQTPDKEFFDTIKAPFKNLAVRPAIKTKVESFGYDCKVLLHPYFRENIENKKLFKFGSISRVDFVKNTHIIAEANAKAQNKCHIYGTINRLYENFKIKEVNPIWKDNYFGEFDPSNACKLASEYEFIIDLTRIKQDGGGFQYTFLEAIDSGCDIILHRDWVKESGYFKEGINCHCVESVEELVELMNNYDNLKRFNHKLSGALEIHNPREFAKDFIGYVNE